MPPRWCAHALAPIHKEAKSATIGHSRKAAEALTAHAARAEYDRSGGVGISVAGSLNPGSFSSAPRMPTLGEDDLRSSTRSGSFPGPPRLNAGRPGLEQALSIVWFPLKPRPRVSWFWQRLVFAR